MFNKHKDHIINSNHIMTTSKNDQMFIRHINSTHTPIKVAEIQKV